MVLGETGLSGQDRWCHRYPRSPAKALLTVPWGEVIQGSLLEQMRLELSHDLQEISGFHVNRSYLSVGCHLLRLKRIFLPGFNPWDSETTKPTSRFRGLRTLRGMAIILMA